MELQSYAVASRSLVRVAETCCRRGADLASELGQNRSYENRLKKAGKPVKLVYAEGYNHYEIAETIANPYGFVGREILEQMRLRPA